MYRHRYLKLTAGIRRCFSQNPARKIAGEKRTGDGSGPVFKSVGSCWLLFGELALTEALQENEEAF